MFALYSTSLPRVGAPRRSRSHVVSFAMSMLGVVLAALTLGGAPAHAEHPTKFMQRVANEMVRASRSTDPEAFVRVLRSHADVPWLGLSSLGSYARQLPRSQRANYYNGMVKFISRYATKEAPKYPVARATVMGATEESSEGVYVDTSVQLRTGEVYDVRWWLVRKGKTFKVRDAQVIGFWMSPFLKNLFENYISENGGNPQSLVVALNR